MRAKRSDQSSRASTLYKRRERVNESGRDADCSDTMIGGHPCCYGQITVIEIQFDKRFGML